MGAYLPWITVIAVIAILVIVAMPFFKTKKPCACDEMAKLTAMMNNTIPTTPTAPLAPVAPSGDVAMNSVAGDLALS